jgi:hypothetical protein
MHELVSSSWSHIVEEACKARQAERRDNSQHLRIRSATGAASPLSIFFEPQVLWRKVSTYGRKHARPDKLNAGVIHNISKYTTCEYKEPMSDTKVFEHPSLLICEKKVDRRTTCAEPKKRERGFYHGL